jgi:hypothetical protein
MHYTNTFRDPVANYRGPKDTSGTQLKLPREIWLGLLSSCHVFTMIAGHIEIGWTWAAACRVCCRPPQERLMSLLFRRQHEEVVGC